MQEKTDRRIISRTRLVGIVLVAGGYWLADRVLKFWFLTHPDFQRDVFVGWLGFRFAGNPGIAFGLPLPLGLTLILTGVVLVAAAVYGRSVYARGRSLELIAGVGIVLGALSNSLDRIRYGLVIDYIDVPWFTVFNLADIAITLGTVVLVWELLRHPKPLDKPSAE